MHELLIKGHNQIQIADILKVSEGTISNDVRYLREEARNNLKTHLEERLPAEYENCTAGINQVLKMSWDIATKRQNEDADKAVSKVDDKTRLQALALANDCYKYKIDLVTNGVVITNAIQFVQQKKEEVLKMREEINCVSKSPECSSEKATTNKIF